MYRNHRVHLLTPNREPSRHQNVPTVSHGPSRNIISQPQYLKATSQRYADFSRFSSIFYLHQALGERTVGGAWTIITTCVLQLAVDEASSNQPFHPLLVLLSLECAFCLFFGGAAATTKKIMREPHFAQNPAMMSYISVLSFVLSA